MTNEPTSKFIRPIAIEVECDKGAPLYTCIKESLELAASQGINVKFKFNEKTFIIDIKDIIYYIEINHR